MQQHLTVLVLVCIITLFMGTSGVNQRRTNNSAILLSTLILSLFLGLRTWWMADVIKYHTQYVHCGGSDWKKYVYAKWTNIGLRWFFHQEYKLTDGNFQIALLIMAFFIMFCVAYTIYKYSVSPFWSYLMYICIGFYFFNFSGLKQAMAMGFILLAFKGIVDDNLIWFLIMTALAGLFHAPALIFMPAYFLSKINLNRRFIIAIIVAMGLAFVFRAQLATRLESLYYDVDDVTINTMTIGGKFAMMIFILFLGNLLRPYTNKDKVYSRVHNLMVVAAVLQSMSVFGNNYTRLADYYFQFIILFIPFIMEYREHGAHPLSEMTSPPIIYLNRDLYILVGVFITVFAFRYYRGYIGTDITGILDYKYFWQVANTPWGS